MKKAIKEDIANFEAGEKNQEKSEQLAALERADKRKILTKKRPTIKKTFKIFYGIAEVTINLNDSITFVTNLTPIAKYIIRIFGKTACRIYGIEYFTENAKKIGTTSESKLITAGD